MLKLKLFNDKEIIERIRQNDPTVLGELFIKYEKMVFSYIKRNGGGDADGEDILQETIIVLWQNVCSGQFELSSKLSTYLMGIAKNKWMAEMRKRKKFSDNEIPETIEDQSTSVLENIIRAEDRIHIENALEVISPVCKQLLLLFYFEERNFTDIARIMEFANADVAKAKKYHCKKTLEDILKTNKRKMERRIE
jgi:RNA polymerase sigma factor (sigma-70 family)